MAKSSPSRDYVLGLDVGDARIGVAMASRVARMPRPLAHLHNNTEVMDQIKQLIHREDIGLVVVGLPRNLEGQETPQSQKVRVFAAELKKLIDCRMEFADESLSTVRAEQAIKNSKSKGLSADSLAACYILEEFFETQGVGA